MIQGIFASNQGIVGDRAGDFASAILQLAPTGTALVLALSSGMGKESAQDTIFHWFEDSHQAGRALCASGGTGVTVVVDDGSKYVPNQILLVEDTGEIIMVYGTRRQFADGCSWTRWNHRHFDHQCHARSVDR
jgi:hypothetical protein